MFLSNHCVAVTRGTCLITLKKVLPPSHSSCPTRHLQVSNRHNPLLHRHRNRTPHSPLVLHHQSAPLLLSNQPSPPPRLSPPPLQEQGATMAARTMEGPNPPAATAASLHFSHALLLQPTKPSAPTVQWYLQDLPLPQASQPLKPHIQTALTKLNRPTNKPQPHLTTKNLPWTIPILLSQLLHKSVTLSLFQVKTRPAVVPVIVV